MSNDKVQNRPAQINLCRLQLLFVCIQINNYNGNSVLTKIVVMRITPNKTIHV